MGTMIKRRIKRDEKLKNGAGKGEVDTNSITTSVFTKLSSISFSPPRVRSRGEGVGGGRQGRVCA